MGSCSSKYTHDGLMEKKSPGTTLSEEADERQRLEEEIQYIEIMLREKLKLEAERKKVNNQLKLDAINRNRRDVLKYFHSRSRRNIFWTDRKIKIDFDGKHASIRPVIAMQVRTAAARINAVRRAASAPPEYLNLKKLPRRARKSRRRMVKEARKLPLAVEDDTYLPFFVQCSREEARESTERKLEEVKCRHRIEREIKIRQAIQRETVSRELAAKEAAILENAVKEVAVWDSLLRDANARRNEGKETGDLELARMEDVAIAIASDEVQEWTLTASNASFREIKYTKRSNREAAFTKALQTWEDENDSVATSTIAGSDIDHFSYHSNLIAPLPLHNEYDFMKNISGQVNNLPLEQIGFSKDLKPMLDVNNNFSTTPYGYSTQSDDGNDFELMEVEEGEESSDLIADYNPEQDEEQEVRVEEGGQEEEVMEEEEENLEPVEEETNSGHGDGFAFILRAQHKIEDSFRAKEMNKSDELQPVSNTIKDRLRNTSFRNIAEAAAMVAIEAGVAYNYEDREEKEVEECTEEEEKKEDLEDVAEEEHMTAIEEKEPEDTVTEISSFLSIAERKKLLESPANSSHKKQNMVVQKKPFKMPKKKLGIHQKVQKFKLADEAAKAATIREKKMLRYKSWKQF